MSTICQNYPLLDAAQAQKHVTHNEALRQIDMMVQLSVLGSIPSPPPLPPKIGDRYLIATPASGIFAGKEGQLALYETSGWSYWLPKLGWTCTLQTDQSLLTYTAQGWQPLGFTQLGIGTRADVNNPFSAKLNTALWTAKSRAEGGSDDLRVTLNKAASAATLSHLYQSQYSGRAEIGLCGDERLHVKVSSDGTKWVEALVIDPTSGHVRLTGSVICGRRYTQLTQETLKVSDSYLAYGPLSAPATLTLPPAQQTQAGQSFLIYDEGGTLSATISLKLTATGSDLLNGKTTYSLVTPYAAVRLISNGVQKWNVASAG